MDVTVTPQRYTAVINRRKLQAKVTGPIYNVAPSTGQITVNLEQRDGLSVCQEQQLDQRVVVPFCRTQIATKCLQGLPGHDGEGVLQVKAGPISVGSTDQVDVILPSVYSTTKWIVTVTDPTLNLRKTSEVIGICNPTGPTQVRFQQYAVMGDSVPHKVIVNYSGNAMRLWVENLHVNEIYVAAGRIPIETHP